MRRVILMWACMLACLIPLRSEATVVSLTSMVLAADVFTRGQYDDAQLGTWNGQPLSPTNHPTVDEDQLSANWKFYVDPNAKNELFLQVTNIADTTYGFIFGPPFSLVALTGFEFSMDVASPMDATFSNQWAVAGEALLGPVSGSSTSLDTTPGWGLSSVSGPLHQRTYAISTPDVDHAFTHFPSVFGTTRIFGGGVFEFLFDPSVDLFKAADFRTLEATASNGLGAYTEPGTLTFAISPAASVPEPTSFALMLTGVLGMLIAASCHKRHWIQMLTRPGARRRPAWMASLPSTLPHPADTTPFVRWR